MKTEKNTKQTQKVINNFINLKKTCKLEIIVI